MLKSSLTMYVKDDFFQLSRKQLEIHHRFLAVVLCNSTVALSNLLTNLCSHSLQGIYVLLPDSSLRGSIMQVLI